MSTRRTLLLLLLLISICLCIAIPSFDKRIGDECFHHAKNETGVCQRARNCKAHVINRGGIRSPDDLKDICNFHGNEPIVCCPGRISKIKCEEYSQAVTKVVQSPILLPGRRPPILESTCHIKPTFVAGGEDAQAGEFPHMALIGFGEGNDFLWGCGGSLISDQYVLTAAHCLYKKRYNSFITASKVRLGALYLNITQNYVKEIKIAQTFKFPEYSRTTKYNDLALLKLQHRVKFSQWIRPACLDQGIPFNNVNYTITGWGQLNETSKPLSNVLQKAKVDLFTTEECTKTYEDYVGTRINEGIQEEKMICAAGKTEAKDTCPGDSGGPLQVKHPNATCMYSIVGVTSFGPQVCGVLGIPAVYTRVSQYLEWIEKTVWQ